MITKLTPSQEKTLDTTTKKWIHLILESGKDFNVKDVRSGIDWLYSRVSLDSPKIILADSYKEQKAQIEKFKKSNTPKFLEQGFGLGFESWLAFYDFFTKIKVCNNEDFNQYCKLMKNGIWSAVFTDTHAFLCKLPIKVKKDQQDKLHSINGGAVQWRNGHENFFIHGVGFKKPLFNKIVNRTLSVKEVIKLENIEQRYIALQHYGAENILKELDAKLIDKSPRGNELYEIPDMIKDTPAKLLKYSCPSTDRVYASFVPNDIMKADQGMSWKFNLTEDQYANLRLES